MRRFRPRLSYANVVATMALFGVLAGGGAYAAQKIGPADIRNQAVLSKHIRNGQVKVADLKNRSVARRLGSGMVFGELRRWGPFSGSLGQRAPLFGQLDDNRRDAPSRGGLQQLTLPTSVRIRDLRMTALSPSAIPRGVRSVERPVELRVHVRRDFAGLGDAILTCRIEAGESHCRARGPSARVRAGQRLELLIFVLGDSSDPTLSERDYAYAMRLAPA